MTDIRYKVYKNLHNGKWSVLDKKSNRVVGHCDAITLCNCDFVIYWWGKKRAIESKRRNVHAFVEGEVVSVENFVPFKERGIEWKPKDVSVAGIVYEVTYNPFVDKGFFLRDTEDEIVSCPMVDMNISDSKSFVFAIF